MVLLAGLGFAINYTKKPLFLVKNGQKWSFLVKNGHFLTFGQTGFDDFDIPSSLKVPVIRRVRIRM